MTKHKEMITAVADAWASMDGRDLGDPDYEDGYMWESSEILRRIKKRGYTLVSNEQYDH